MVQTKPLLGATIILTQGAIDKPLVPKQHIIFAGKRWEVTSINDDNKLITLKKAKGGRPPTFSGDGLMIHDIVRYEMRRIYHEGHTPAYLNDMAKALLEEGIDNYHSLNLDYNPIIQRGSTVHILPWLGDRATNTITVLLQMHGLLAECFGGIIDIRNSSPDDFYNVVKKILSGPKISPTELANFIPNTIIEKHDPILPKEIRDIGYGARAFDVDTAWKWLDQFYNSHNIV